MIIHLQFRFARNTPTIYLYYEDADYADLDYWYVTTIEDEEFVNLIILQLNQEI